METKKGPKTLHTKRNQPPLALYIKILNSINLKPKTKQKMAEAKQ
jgi:hypothetical protein